MSAASLKEAAGFIKTGAVGVIPTDTIYGIVCSALNKAAVERLYRIRERNEHKPCITLIPDASILALFGVTLDAPLKEALARVWPGAVSVILDCPDERFAHLHRGTKSLAFRVPDDENLRNFLRETGPLLAPSANPEGKPPACTIAEARAYFGDPVDFYVDGGTLSNKPSTLVSYQNGNIKVIRQGAGHIGFR